MNEELRRATIVNLLVNIFLFFLNLTIGFIYSSISLISKALESIHDILTAVIIHVTVKINNKKPDSCHPFGHSRAESIVSYTIGVIMVIIGLKIIEISYNKFLLKEIIEYSYLLLVATLITIIVKSMLYFYIKKVAEKYNSSALKANMIDHRNDIFMMLGVFVAVISIKYGLYFMDSLVGFFIALVILKSGFQIAIENVNQLMGSNANDAVAKEIENIVKNSKDVLGVNTIKTQYLGNKIQAEVHIELDSKMSLQKAHDIGKKVKYKIEDLDDINNCFVHLDVYEK